MLNQYQTPKTNLTTFPLEILEKISSYLNPNDLVRLRLACRSLNVSIDSPALDVLWQPFLNRLRTIDIQAFKALDPLDSIFRRFGIAFEQINNNQLEEIEHFKAMVSPKHPYSIFPDEMTSDLLTITHKATQLEALEQRNHFLNRLNSHLVRSEIRLGEKTLNIAAHNLTRFPDELFEDTSLEDYWSSLTILLCSNNPLQSLPNSIGKCTSLKKLYCHDNRLHSLPETLVSCMSIEGIYCQGNQLTTLPKTLKNCRKLKSIICNDNQIEYIPDGLGSHALVELYCPNNRLLSLPTTVWAKLGESTCRYLLDKQNTHSVTQAHTVYLASQLDQHLRISNQTDAAQDRRLNSTLNTHETSKEEPALNIRRPRP